MGMHKSGWSSERRRGSYLVLQRCDLAEQSRLLRLELCLRAGHASRQSLLVPDWLAWRRWLLLLLLLLLLLHPTSS